MSTTEDLSIKPYMFEPESERDENEDDEPAEQHLHMDVSQRTSRPLLTFC